MAGTRSEQEPRFLTRKQAARYLTGLGLSISYQTLARYFGADKGPLCMRVGNRAMYRKTDLDDYLLQQCSAPRQSSKAPLEPAKPDDLPPLADDVANDRAEHAGRRRDQA
ncbi:MAG TPA: hypothetical protein PKY87_15280 [Terricaulis sp.]|nr:hypothetical protein [Terricaulis sp.]